MNEQKILSASFKKIKKYLQEDQQARKPVVRYSSPSKLKKTIDFSITENGVTEEEFTNLLEKYLEYSVRTGHKQFFNQLYSGFNLPAFIGEVCTALTNTSMYTYEVAPVATMIENEMIDLMNKYTGYKNGDGLFVSGGSNANMLAMLSARNIVAPETRHHGYDRNLKLTAFVNEYAHYSFETAANLIGIGAKNVIKVEADKNGQIIVSALEKAIKNSISQGEKPFFVAATCATTLMGSYDPLDKMSKICKKFKLWLHADGSFGGSVILSDKHRHLLKGISKTDSFTWNPHKLMNVPLICSALLLKKRGLLHNNITDIDTDYIFHQDDTDSKIDTGLENDWVEDLGKKSIQCGRKVDAVKLWFAWKYYGLEGYQKRINNLIDMAQYAESLVKQNPEFELLAPRQSFAVCFRYNPQKTESTDETTKLNNLNLDLRESLRKQGKSIVNYGYLGEKLVIRLITANGQLDKSDIDTFFENILDETAKLK